MFWEGLNTRKQSVKKPIRNSAQLPQHLRRFMDQLKCINPLKMNYHSDLFFQWLVPPTYNLPKLLIFILLNMTKNHFTFKDSFTLVDKILTKDSDLNIANLDVDSLFTKISLDDTIDICINKPFQNPKSLVNWIPKNGFLDLLNYQRIALPKNHFLRVITSFTFRWIVCLSGRRYVQCCLTFSFYTKNKIGLMNVL